MEQIHTTEQHHTEYAQGLHIMNALADYAIQQEGGAIDALAAFITLSRIEKMCADLKGQVKDQAMTEAAKWHEKTFHYFGVEVQKKAAGGRWDFKGLKDWQAAKANIYAIEERAKAAYQQATKFGATTVTADGGWLEMSNLPSIGIGYSVTPFEDKTVIRFDSPVTTPDGQTGTRFKVYPVSKRKPEGQFNALR